MQSSTKNRWTAATFAISLFGCATAIPASACAAGDAGNINRGSHLSAASNSDWLWDFSFSLIVTWLSSNFDLPANYDHPHLVVLPAEKISDLRYGSVAMDRRREVIAVYDHTHRAIYVSTEWNGRSPADTSVLVHEMVHHLQNLDERSYDCPQAREQLAYVAQEKWLGLFGRSLESEFEIDGFTLKFITNCATH